MKVKNKKTLTRVKKSLEKILAEIQSAVVLEDEELNGENDTFSKIREVLEILDSAADK